MWVLTERDDLLNLDQATAVAILANKEVVAIYNHGSLPQIEVLCSCDNEERGKQIIGKLADRIARGQAFAQMRVVKKEVAEGAA